MYYNTTHESGEVLKDSQVKAETQEDVVLGFFKKYPNSLFTPFDIHSQGKFRAPITSIRRCITNLTDEGKLLKTNYKRGGEWGKPNYMWTLKKEEGQTTLNF